MAKRKKVPKPIRDKLLLDAMHRCCLCPEHPDITDLHHIDPISKGGPDTEENLMAVCPNCHGKITRLRSQYTPEQLRVYKERWGRLCALGLPLDVRLAQAFDFTKPPLPPHILLPPQPHFAHPYPLQQNFTGRARERQMLTEWLTQDNRPVLVMVALGGMGKSALTWVWAMRDILGRKVADCPQDPEEVAEACRVGESDRPEGVLWWSFYEREASFESFLNDAIAYASGGNINPAEIPSTYDKLRELLGLLQQRRVLLVLDGLERELRAYASLNAAYQGDKVADDAKQDFRTCTDPHARDFLRSIASPATQSRILITSRLMPRDLEGHDGRPLAACRHEELTEFDPDDAVTFFRAEGVHKGTRAEIQAACKRYGYHPLALRLLAGVIVNDPAKPGDVSVAGQYDVSGDLKPREHNILKVSYDVLAQPLRRLLSRVAAFRSPVDYEAVKAIGGFKKEEKLKASLKELTQRGLLLFDKAKVRYDLHSIVRQYAYDRLGDKEGVHERLREYFDAVPKPDQEKIQSIEDLAPTIELYHHTVGAGRYDEALSLFRDRVADPLYYRFGAYEVRIELLRGLFPDGEARPPRLESKRDQSWTLTALANCYSLLGHPREGVGAFELGNRIKESVGDKLNLAIGLVNLADDQLKLGDMRAAEASLRRAVKLFHELGDEFQKAVAHQDLGRLLVYEGSFKEAEDEFEVSTEHSKRIANMQVICVVESYRSFRSVLMGEARPALGAAQRARELADEVARVAYPIERDFVRAQWVLGAANVALAGEGGKAAKAHLDEAEAHLAEALTRCRKINMVDHEAAILLSWAKWHRLSGDAASAKRDAKEALRIADRCEYRLQQADIHNFLALLALEEEDHKEAKREAEIAKERALCDGPPHCYKPALDEAEKLLKQIG